MLFFCYAIHNVAAIKQFKARLQFNLIDEPSIARKFVQKEDGLVNFFDFEFSKYFEYSMKI